MEQDYQQRELEHRPFSALKKILKLGLLGSVVAIGYSGYQKFDLFKLDPAGAVTVHEFADNFAIKTGIGLGQTVGEDATKASLKGITDKNSILYQGNIFDGELLGVSTISSTALQPGQTYYFPDAAKIKGDLKNVHILAQGRMIVEGSCTNCTLSVENVPFYGHSERGYPIGLGPGVAVGTNGQANDGLVYPGQPALVVTGIATNSVLWADNAGEIQVGENHGSTLRTTGRTYIGVAPQLEAGQQPNTDPASVVIKGSDGSMTIITSGQNGTSVKTVIQMSP